MKKINRKRRNGKMERFKTNMKIGRGLRCFIYKGCKTENTRG